MEVKNLGLIPWKVTKGEKIFYSFALTIALGFIGLRFLEEIITMWGVLAIALVLSFIIIEYG